MRRICATVAVLAFCGGLAVVGVGLAGAKNKKANSNASINVGFVSGSGVPFFEVASAPERMDASAAAR